MKLFFDAGDQIPFHVTGKCPDRVWPTERLSDVWTLFEAVLSDYSKYSGVRTHAFVLMRNHYHWLCTIPETSDPAQLFSSVHEAVAFDFKLSLQMDYICKTGLDPAPLFDAPPKIILLNHPEAYRRAYAYIYRNPVKAGIVERAELYPYSTLPYVLGRAHKKLKFTCLDNMNLIYDPHKMLQFINAEGPYSDDSLNFEEKS